MDADKGGSLLKSDSMFACAQRRPGQGHGRPLCKFAIHFFSTPEFDTGERGGKRYCNRPSMTLMMMMMMVVAMAMRVRLGGGAGINVRARPRHNRHLHL